MKKTATVTIFLLLTVECLQAQKKDKWEYASLTQGGVAIANSNASYTVQTVQGIRKNSWFTGLGIGIDNQGIPNLPLVAHVQKSFNGSRFQPFAYTEAGVQLPWKKGKWNAKTGYSANEDLYKINTGYLAEIGAGYLFSLHNKQTPLFVVSAGYSFKTNKVQERNTVGFCGTPPLTNLLYVPYYNKWYSNNRLILKAGVFF